MTLQGVGMVNAIAASEIEVGDILMWNYGYTSTVKAIRRTAKSVVIVTVGDNGREYERRRHNDSEVCVINR